MLLNRILTILVCASLLLPTTLAAAPLQLGGMALTRDEMRRDNSLRHQMRGRAALLSYRNVSRVGGVNFEGVVDLGQYQVDLDYDPTLPDGERAILTLNGAEYTIPLYDWQLQPIVAYADSPYTAVVSIFGEGPEPETYRYIDYHPAFEDTHLGLRLLQTDILLMNPLGFSEAPKQNGQAVYMPGESREVAATDREKISDDISSVLEGAGFRAWVFTDTDVSPKLSLSDGEATVTLEPYFFFWTTELFDRFQALAEAQKLAMLRAIIAPADSPLQDSAMEAAQKIEAEMESLYVQISAQEIDNDGPPPNVIEVAQLVTEVQQNYSEFRKIAPFVFDAAEDTAQFAALFRGARAVATDDWQEFHDEVMQEIDLPVFETPNRIPNQLPN